MLQSPVAESRTKIKARAQFVYNLLCLRIYLILISVDGFLMFSFFFFFWCLFKIICLQIWKCHQINRHFAFTSLFSFSIRKIHYGLPSAQAGLCKSGDLQIVADYKQRFKKSALSFTQIQKILYSYNPSVCQLIHNSIRYFDELPHLSELHH